MSFKRFIRNTEDEDHHEEFGVNFDSLLKEESRNQNNFLSVKKNSYQDDLANEVPRLDIFAQAKFQSETLKLPMIKTNRSIQQRNLIEFEENSFFQRQKLKRIDLESEPSSRPRDSLAGSRNHSKRPSQVSLANHLQPLRKPSANAQTHIKRISLTANANILKTTLNTSEIKSKVNVLDTNSIGAAVARKKNRSIFMKASILKLFTSSSPQSNRFHQELESVNLIS